MLRKYSLVSYTILSLLLFNTPLTAQDWTLQGNGNLLANSFLGTTKSSPLSIKTNNIERVHIDAFGRIFSNAWWGLNAEPDQNYRLSVGGNIWAEGLTTPIISTNVNQQLQFQTNGETRLFIEPLGQVVANGNFWSKGGVTSNIVGAEMGKSLNFQTNGVTKLYMGTGGQMFSDENAWWGLGVYPSQTYRLSVNGKIRAGGLTADSVTTPIVSATFDKDLVLKAGNKEHFRIYKGGQGISIPSFVGIGAQPDGINKLYVNGSTFSQSLKSQTINVTNALLVQNAQTTLNVAGDGRIIFKKWVGINMEPEQQYALAVAGNGFFSNKIHIGTVQQDQAWEYKLAVAGKIICEEVKVQLKADWPDYVFENSYNLMPLKDVETFINKNKHLPGVPSAQQIQKQEGVEVGNMQALLLQKIEELTLHMIELKKENDLLKQKFDTLNK